jgi:hypothetical protein
MVMYIQDDMLPSMIENRAKELGAQADGSLKIEYNVVADF